MRRASSEPEDAHARSGARRPTHDAVGKGGGKQLDVIGRINEQPSSRFTRRQLVERVGELCAIGTGESDLPPPLPPPLAGEGSLIFPPPLAGEGREGARQGGQHVAMARCEFAERMRRPRPCDAFERRQRIGEPGKKLRGGGKLDVGQLGARIGGMQIDRLVAPEFFELGAKAIQRVRQAAAAGTRTRPAQDRAL